MIINSFALAVAIVASLLCLIFLVWAISETVSRRRQRSKPDLYAQLAAESSQAQRMRIEEGRA
jgi:hypothetical protein